MIASACAMCGRHTIYFLCHDCASVFVWVKSRAHSRVMMAVKRGDLPKPTTKRCADCGAPAKCYDHRYYGRPLDVDPVCLSCDKRRGPGLDCVELLKSEAENPTLHYWKRKPRAINHDYLRDLEDPQIMAELRRFLASAEPLPNWMRSQCIRLLRQRHHSETITVKIE